MNYVFDIDGTICTDSKGNYHEAKPIWERIEVVNSLFESGHVITFYTARGMGSSDNNSEKAIEKWQNLTIRQLEEWKVKYHKLFLGKPAGDIYIDDKGIGAADFFNAN